ncbi:unnamed protein product [Caenorhabditis brenneri]
MTEYLKNKPIALRHCFLYVFLQESSVEKAFTELCEVIGKDTIKKEEHEFWFDKFKNGIFDIEKVKKPITDMKDILRGNKNALRACILYEFLKFKYAEFEENDKFIHHPAFSMYMHFCKVIGENVMDYQEFDFWFYRFANGEFDLKFERDKEQKIHELSDMPLDIMKNIVQYLDIIDRLSLERTSQSLRLFSQDQKVFQPYLKLDVHHFSIYISIGKEHRIHYMNEKNDCVMTYGGNSEVLHGVSYLKKALRDFKKILENPKLYVKTLIIISWGEDSESSENYIENALKFTHLLHVQHLSLQTKSSPLLNILPFLKPVHLTAITINIDSDEAKIGKVVETEQWKQAKFFNMGISQFISPLRHLYHFHEFTVILQKLSIDDVREMKESLLKSSEFEQCTLVLPNFVDPATIMQDVFRRASFRMTEFLRNNPIALRHCLLYIFLHEESINDLFDDFCKTVGPDIIRKEEFQHWFNQFAQRKFDDNKEPITYMKDILRSDKNALRACIFYESLKYKHPEFKKNDKSIHHPVFSVYMHFCKVIGDDVMEYREFDFWFYRFANGVFDLKFEKDEKHKIYELTDMPVDIMKNIVEYLDMFERLSLEKTSKSLRLFSQNQKVFHRGLTFRAGLDRSYISFGVWDEIKYKNEGDDCEIEFRKSKKHLSLHSKSMKALLHILSSLKPGYLNTITINNDLDEATIGELVEMDQWKQAKYLNMSSYLFDGPLHHLYHFHEFTAMRQELFIDDVREMKEILLKSPDFKKCNLVFRRIDDRFSIMQEFDDFGFIIFRMTEFLKNNPIALRHCLLYVFLQKKPVAFDDFCETIGHDVINKEQFQYWFDQFEQGKFDDKKQSIPDMNVIIRSDKQALRVCVLYEWLATKNMDLVKRMKSLCRENKGLSPFAEYMNFCKVIGDDVMEYRDFEFWFYRFANGVFDLKFERDKIKKIYELMDMPIDIMRNIVEYLDIADRLSLERTSQSLRSFSQNQKVFQPYLRLDVNRVMVIISFGNEHRILYVNEGEGNYCVKTYGGNSEVLPGVSYLKKALRDFQKILGNPKLYVDTLIISSRGKDSELFKRCIEDALKFTHLLHVQHFSLRMHSMKALLNILPSLKPGCLTTITIDNDAEEDEIEEIIKMNQWKQAKHLDMGFKWFCGPLRHLYHFHEFTVTRQKLFIDDVREMKEILLKSPDFEKCTLYFRVSDDPITIRRVFGGPIEGISFVLEWRNFSKRIRSLAVNACSIFSSTKNRSMNFLMISAKQLEKMSSRKKHFYTGSISSNKENSMLRKSPWITLWIFFAMTNKLFKFV